MAVVSDYRALLSGSSWTGGIPGQAVELTYSFSTAPTAKVASSNPAAAATFQPLNDAEKTVVRGALAQWAAASGVTFRETVATPGDMAFGFYDLLALGEGAEAGMANYPSVGAYLAGGTPQIYSNFLTEGGDVAFDRAYRASAAFGSDFAHVALHEIGHALGLKHPFDPAGSGGVAGDTLAAALDTGSQTVMAYAGTRSGTLGTLDVAAIQYLYGTKAGAARPIARVWNPATESFAVTGTGAAEILFGSGGNDIFQAAGRDAVSGAEGDDSVFTDGGPVSVNGGPGRDAVVTGLTWTTSTVVGGSGSFRYIYLPNATQYAVSDRFQSYVDVETLYFTNGAYDMASGVFTPGAAPPGQGMPGTAAPSIGWANATTGQASTAAMDAVGAGAPNYLQWQFIYSGVDDMAMSVSAPNVFIHSGSGNDAIQVTGGQNVLDGGSGSNFLTGGTGTGADTFFTDARNAGVVWNTIRNFHAGDAATLWGFVPGVSSYRWESGVAGAAGSTGATLRANIVGGAGRTGDGIDASITFTGMSVEQARGLQLVTGTQAAGSYLYVYNPGV